MAAAICAHSPERVPGAMPALADGGHVLAGESADEDVHGLDPVPVDSGDVAQVRGLRPVSDEDSRDGLVELGEPHRSGVEDVLDSEVETAIAAEQRPDPES